MKKLLSCLLTFCMLFGLGIYNINNSMPIEARDTNIEIIDEPLEGEEFNHIFTQQELKGTEYEGKNVEVKDGVMYVEGRSVAAAAVYLYTVAGWAIVGYISSGGSFQAIVDYTDQVMTAAQFAKEAWAVYQNRVKTVYANVAAYTATVNLTDGNVCVRQSASRYACKFEGTPDKPIVE